MTLKTNKALLWLSHFLDSSNSSTFLHRTNSAIAARYKNLATAKIAGSQNYKKFAKEINAWLDECGLSEPALKTRLINLLDAKEIRYFAHEGLVTDQREVPALGIQRQALDMAFKIKGMYAPEKRENTGPGGAPLYPDTIKIVLVRPEDKKRDLER